MSFPVYLQTGPVALHLHWVFESLAYTFTFLAFRRQRRLLGDVVDARTRWWVIGAATIGGLVGSRLLYLIEILVGACAAALNNAEVALPRPSTESESPPIRIRAVIQEVFMAFAFHGQIADGL